ncbi:MAG: DUF2157 domain-containing protein [Verrucomicrobiae bacterium]|nr:DUF2157 domain-containing protein [Verrucomicrobiae bacterium]
MKTTDIHRIRDAGLITEQQAAAIIEHFRLDQQVNKLMVILGAIGAVLVGAGVILLLAANWADIPRGVKLASALALLVGAHFAGWWLSRGGNHPVVAQAMHLIGSILFLANIALIGQVYHLSSRPANAILLWLVGIAGLPWLLRSRAQQVLTLFAFGLWFGMALPEARGWVPANDDRQLFVVYALLGAVVCGWGAWLTRTRFAELGPITEKLGLIAMHVCLFPLTLGFYYEDEPISGTQLILPGVFTVVAFGIFLLEGARSRLIPDAQWRMVWAGSLCGVAVLAWIALFGTGGWDWRMGSVTPGWHWLASSRCSSSASCRSTSASCARRMDGRSRHRVYRRPRHHRLFCSFSAR